MNVKLATFITLFLMLISTNSIAQNNATTEKKLTFSEKKAARKALKAERRAAQDSLQMIAYQKAMVGVMDSLFVLESFQVYDRKGNSAQVSETTNFIQLQKDEVTVQLTFPFASGGPNGIGGVTLDGRLQKYEIKETKKGVKMIRLSVFGSSLNADITLTIYPGSNRAEAQVSAATLPYKVKYVGNLYHINESSVYKGRSIF